MEALLKTGNITKKDVLAHPDLVLDVLEFTHNQNKKAEEEAKGSNEALPPEQTITLSTRALSSIIFFLFNSRWRALSSIAIRASD
jgi:hypothetical protein